MKVFTRKSIVKSFMFGVIVGALLVTGGLFATGHLALGTSYDGLSFK